MAEENYDAPAEMFTARAELTLAQPDRWVLGDTKLNPDPLSPIFAAFGQFRPELGERPAVDIDLLPVNRGRLMKRRKKLASESGRGGQSNGAGLLALFGGLGEGATGGGLGDMLGQLNDPMAGGSSRGGSRGRQTRPPASQAIGTEKQHELFMERQAGAGLRDTNPHFQVQIFLTATSRYKERTIGLLQTLIASFEQFADENYFRVKGRMFRGIYFGSDDLWSRPMFDFRRKWGPMGDTKDLPIVSASQLGGILVPATKHCKAPRVARTGGIVPAPPHDLPKWSPDRADLTPWCLVRRDDEVYVAGIPTADLFFDWTGGRSRFGKTETQLVRCRHRAEFVGTPQGEGFFYLDPHADAITDLKKSLPPHVNDHVIEMSLARNSSRHQIGWNPLSMEGLGPDDIEDKMNGVINSFASAMDWDSNKAPRTNTLLLHSVAALLELSLALPDDIAPTIFQITTILTNEEWREAVVPLLSAEKQHFWINIFPSFADDAVGPLTNVLERLRQTPSIAAVLGSSRSTWDLRKAMDEGKIVLVQLGTKGPTDALIASLLVFDLLRATMSRWDLSPDQRRRFHAYLDELQTYDMAVGGLIAQALEEAAKYGLSMHLSNQDPSRLSKRTWGAIATNRSALMSTNLDADPAAMLSRQWAGQVKPENILGLNRFEFITSVTHQGKVSAPFRGDGLWLNREYGEPNTEAQIAELNAAIARNSGYRPIDDIRKDLVTLDDRIKDYALHGHKVVAIGSASAGRPGPGRSGHGSGNNGAPVSSGVLRPVPEGDGEE